MISFETALSQILEHTPEATPQHALLLHSLGRVLSRPLVSPIALPNFDNSAVDGFGVRVADLTKASLDTPCVLRLQGSVYAGDPGQLVLKPQQTIRILTGAPIPEGVEAVVMKEDTTLSNEHVSFSRSARTGENIRRCGEEFAVGDRVLPKGTRVTPPVLGVAASLGLTELPVYQSPRVALIVTGSELVAPGAPLAAGQIYESNSVALQGALHSLGIDTVQTFRVADEAQALQNVMAQALSTCDVVLTTGGVSVGEMDLVKDTWEALQVETVFWKVAIKPGKPFYFGHSQRTNTLVFGLPGNPVASLLTFKMLVEPALRKIMGERTFSSPQTVQANLTQAIRQKPGRLSWVRATLHRAADGTVTITPVSGQGSHMMGGLAQADALLPFEAEASSLPEGSPVQAIPLVWQGA